MAYDRDNVYVSDIKTTYTSLTYANGPGGLKEIRRQNLSDEQVGNLIF